MGLPRRSSPALRNTRTGAWLAEDLEIAGNVWARGVGLLGRRDLPQGHGLYIPHCNSIHSLFMAFPFDALFLDKSWKVVHAIDSMRPFRLSRIVFGADGVVELPAGTARATETRIGDILELTSLPQGGPPSSSPLPPGEG